MWMDALTWRLRWLFVHTVHYAGLCSACRDNVGFAAAVVWQKMSGDACSMPSLALMICTAAIRASNGRTTGIVMGGCSEKTN